MQNLYTIMYPSKNVAKVDELYIKGDGYIINSDSNEIEIAMGKRIHFCTYYNAFSLEKWKKYTYLSSLFLCIKAKGKFCLNIYTKFLTAGDYLDKLLYSKIWEVDGFTQLQIDLTKYLDQPGLLYFEIQAFNDNCVFSSASYATNTPYEIINLGIVICTYKRESYIQKFVSNFKECSQIDHLHAFISDNGNTLPLDTFDRLHIVRNKNYGGAGGFSRGMLEIKSFNKRNKDQLQYILLMDDDIVLDFNIFERLLSFISLKKELYDNYFIAGSMCSLDYPFLQYEKYASWRGNSFIQFGASYDLRDENTIITNEREEHLKNCSAGWWFSCFPVKFITPNNYPFPCFFRGDDMEYTIRNGSNIITLNGLNVWHEPFYKKYSIISEKYYLYRNSLVINSLYLPELKYKHYIKYLLKSFIVSIITYDYKGAELILRGWKDYCKGVDFFLNTNPELLNKELMQENYHMEPLEQVMDEYLFDDINYNIYIKKDKNKLSSLIRHLTGNGFLIPKCFYKEFSFAHIGFGARYINFYCTKRIFNFDPFTRKGYFTVVSKSKAVSLLFLFIKQALYFKRHFTEIKNEYQQNFYKLQTENFWRSYLDIED